jgi:hypothetical protein
LEFGFMESFCFISIKIFLEKNFSNFRVIDNLVIMRLRMEHNSIVLFGFRMFPKICSEQKFFLFFFLEL